jgi:hypothetical protein
VCAGTRPRRPNLKRTRHATGRKSLRPFPPRSAAARASGKEREGGRGREGEMAGVLAWFSLALPVVRSACGGEPGESWGVHGSGASLGSLLCCSLLLLSGGSVRLCSMPPARLPRAEPALQPPPPMRSLSAGVRSRALVRAPPRAPRCTCWRAVDGAVRMRGK